MVRAHAPRLLTVARRIMGNPQDAADCVQEGMLSAFRRIETFDGRSALGTWLHRIVVNAALMKLRKRKSRTEASLDGLMPVLDQRDCRIEPLWVDRVSVDDLIASKDTQRIVREAIDSLPQTHRTVLLLRDIEGLDTAQTADYLELSTGAVKVRLHRARSALKKLLEPVIHPGGEAK